MAEEEDGFFLPMYVEEGDAEEAAAAAKQKRRQESASKKKPVEVKPWMVTSEEERAREAAIMEQIWEYDPKSGNRVLVRADVTTLPHSISDLDEESPIGAMRYSSMAAAELMPSANIISLKVVASEVGFPVNVYGTVFVRDELDHKRICLFRRQRNNPQLVKCQDEALTLTGPSRGLIMFRYLYFEIDLKIRVVNDKNFSKGFLKESAAVSAATKIIRNKFSSKLSTLELAYSPVEKAVEATIKIKITRRPAVSNSARSSVKGGLSCPKGSTYFNGKITARTSRMPDDIILYDSEASGSVITVDDDGFMELSRSVIAVPIYQLLVIGVAVADHHHGLKLSTITIDAIPEICGAHDKWFDHGSYAMEATVIWSALYDDQVDTLSHKCRAVMQLDEA